MTELIGFLTPTTRLDVRRAALEYIVGVSGALDGSAGKLFIDKDFQLGKALCSLCENSAADRTPCLAALTNFASGSPDVAGHILSCNKLVIIAYTACCVQAPYGTYGARLLANLSRHLPDHVYEQLHACDKDFLPNILKLLSAATDEDCFLGYVLVNISTVPKLRKHLHEGATLKTVFTLMNKGQLWKEVAADILRNMCFEESIHEQLLDDSDEFLVSLLQPLADANDNLDDEEMQKLPVRLQYYEGERESSSLVRQKLIEALYQLCATRHGREALRKKGVYALLRELDRATTEPADPKAPPPKMRPPQLLAQEEHTLHALIGVLIRYEEEMGVEGFSLKQLE